MSDADRRLAGALRKQRADAQRERLDTIDDTEETESRAAIVKKRRGPGRPRKTPPSHTPSTAAAKIADVGTRASGTASDSDFGRPEHKTANGATETGQADISLNGGFVKRKKIRSRQKNLKKDNRPKDQLPPHLTEETLGGGRVYKETSFTGTRS